MKCLLTSILIVTCFFSAFAQGGIFIKPNLIEDGRYISAFADEDGDYIAYKDQNGILIEVSHPQGRLASYLVIPETISMYMLDDDDGIESLSQQGNLGSYGDANTTLMLLDDNGEETVLSRGEFYGIAQTSEGAMMAVLEPDGTAVTYYPLPGNTPEYTRKQRETNRVDTIYVEHTITQIDTIRELITERIFTSDTVYINETITLAGDVDTLVVNRTVTTRDTVYNFTEHTEYITRVDSVYLLGGDYLADLNSVTSVENQLEVEKLGNPYPNPATTTVSIDYVTAVPTSNMLLGVYDNQGRRVEQFPVKPSHTITFDVSDWSPGVYVYMIWSSVGVSSTKRLVVQ